MSDSWTRIARANTHTHDDVLSGEWFTPTMSVSATLHYSARVKCLARSAVQALLASRHRRPHWARHYCRVIVPAEAVSTTLSSLAPSSRRRIRNVWLPAGRLLNVVGVTVRQPLPNTLFCVVHPPASSL